MSERTAMETVRRSRRPSAEKMFTCASIVRLSNGPVPVRSSPSVATAWRAFASSFCTAPEAAAMAW